MPSKPKDLAGIGAALNQISWEWLNDNRPALAEALAVAVGRGTTAVEVRRFVMHRTERRELALRCEQAARWLAGQE
jgi:hypothetical protein